MTTLTDTQRILLSTASQREGGSILPLPACLKPGGSTAKALDTPSKRGLTEEREKSDAGAVRRIDGDLQFGPFLTAAGLEAIGIEVRTQATDGAAFEVKDLPKTRSYHWNADAKEWRRDVRYLVANAPARGWSKYRDCPAPISGVSAPSLPTILAS